jgi:hypothetical protein
MDQRKKQDGEIKKKKGRLLVTGFSPRRLGFDPRSVRFGFVANKVALKQVFPRVLRFFPVSFIPPVLH